MSATERLAPAPIDPKLSEVVSNRRVGPDWYRLRLRERSIAERALPGSFVQVLCAEGESWDPLLRRPFSVYCTDPAGGTYDILYTKVGRGTRWMAALPEPPAGGASGGACTVDVLGPLGNSFSPPLAGDRVHLAGGGVGVAPLYFLALQLLALPDPPAITFAMGARTARHLEGADDFRKLPVRTCVATDDGTEGFHGRVTELFSRLLDEESAPERVQVYGCGPQGMNESLRALAVARGVRCEICLESLMACGFGICFGCVLPIRREPGGEFYNRRICREGPVFDARLLHAGIEG